MCDLNWCPVCDKAIPQSLSLYCSNECLQKEALQHNPLLGYDFAEFKYFLATPTKRRNLRMDDTKNFNNNNNIKNKFNYSNTTITTNNNYCYNNNNNKYHSPPPTLSHSTTTTDDEQEDKPPSRLLPPTLKSKQEAPLYYSVSL